MAGGKNPHFHQNIFIQSLYIYIYVSYIKLYIHVTYIYIYWIYPPHPSIPVTTMTHFQARELPNLPKPRISQASSVRANRSHTSFWVHEVHHNTELVGGFNHFKKQSKSESSPNRDENEKYLKPPTSGYIYHKYGWIPMGRLYIYLLKA